MTPDQTTESLRIRKSFTFWRKPYCFRSYFLSQKLIIITFLTGFLIFLFKINSVSVELFANYSGLVFLPIYVSEKTQMGNVQEAIHLGIGMIAADFLSNTKRGVQAIELWNECLILLNNKTLENEHELAKKVRITLYKKLFYGNAAITKLSPAIESGKKLLVLLRNLRRKKKEG